MESWIPNNEDLNDKDNQEIDFEQFFNVLLNKKFHITLLTFLGLLGSTIFAITENKIWQGEFQIVLSKPNDKNILSQEKNSLISKYINDGLSNNMATEVEILKSPSVLLPIFNYVKEYKINKGEKLNKWKYSDWSENSLSLDLLKGTNILNINYKDEDKELIPKVLEKVSNTYQSYTERNKQRSLENVLNYLEKQLSIYKNKSANSLKESESFAIEQNLSVFNDNNAFDLEMQDTINVEKTRIQAANKIQKINVQLEQLKNVGDDESKIIYLGNSIEDIVSQELTSEIDKIDSQILYKRMKFQENDQSIQILLKKRKQLIYLLKDKIKTYLNSELYSTNALLKSSERPKEVLIKYKELLRESKRDEKTLATLEADLTVVKLEKEKNEEPWELITDLTVLDSPIYPNKRKIVVLGFFISILFSSGIFILKNIKDKIIFSSKIIKKFLPDKFIQIKIYEDKNLNEEIKLISNSILFDDKKEKIAIIPVGIINENIYNVFFRNLKDALSHKKLLLEKSLLDAKKYDYQILIMQSGKVSEIDIYNVKSILDLQGITNIGTIFLKEEKKDNWISFLKTLSSFRLKK